MKKILLLNLIILFGLGIQNDVFSQKTRRLGSGEPYTIYYIAKGHLLNSKADLDKNYNNGLGANFGIEYQFKELKLGIGMELGYTYINPNSYKLQYLPRKYLFPANQIPFTIYANYYLHNEHTYYNFFDRVKPYIGLGIGTIWGRYDYSLSNDDNKRQVKEGYYLREYEGQSGFRVGVLPRVGLIISTYKHAFGFEYGYQYYHKNGRLETQSHQTFGLTYIYVVD